LNLEVRFEVILTSRVRAMAEEVSGRSLAAESRVRHHVSTGDIRGGRSDNGIGQSPGNSGFPSQDNSVNVRYSPSSTFSSYRKEKRVISANLANSNTVAVNGKHWMEKYFSFSLQAVRWYSMSHDLMFC
jgi:hypothetical protein